MEIGSISHSAVPKATVAPNTAPSVAAAKATPEPAPAATPVPPPTMAQLTQAVGDINKSVKSSAPGLEFSIDEDSQRTVVKVVDQQTKELIRQMPSAEALEIAKALDKMQGLLINQKA